MNYPLKFLKQEDQPFLPITSAEAVMVKHGSGVIKLDDVIGIAIATRADCISDECLNYLKELNKKTFLSVELGLQTIHEKTSILIKCIILCILQPVMFIDKICTII